MFEKSIFPVTVLVDSLPLGYLFHFAMNTVLMNHPDVALFYIELFCLSVALPLSTMHAPMVIETWQNCCLK